MHTESLLVFALFWNFTNATTCKQWCVTKNSDKCSNVTTCKVIDRVIPETDLGKPPPVAEFLNVLPSCYRYNNQSVIGLIILWEIKGQYLKDQSVLAFYLDIIDVGGLGGFPSQHIQIDPNATNSYEHYIHFEIFYSDYDPEFGPLVLEQGKYLVTLQSLPILYSELPYHPKTTPQEIKKTIEIPEYSQIRNCPLQNKTTTPSPTEKTLTERSKDQNSKKDLTMIVVLIVMFIILMVVITAGITAIKLKKQKAIETRNSPRAQNILVMLNVNDRTEVGKQTNWMATALNRTKNLGLTVKYNKWETKDVAEKGIVHWMQERIEWADKVIISSTPNQLRTPETSDTFEKAFDHIMATNIFVRDNIPVLVVHFEKKENHTHCPFFKNERYPKFQLKGGNGDDWKKLCRNIAGRIAEEREPLQNNNQHTQI